ncbi:hypothetical protein B5E58_00965 [Tyzzerella sp. An114]|uniref:hypothetical protein n=1 Tax=Tyzzerella sp. An114 TaxID=1965545 RepID=UPI000B436BE8|nr:hypothetical protein [Tyzzerella sp. An114]OUQ60470.1 hypothetical protein B5E58_00965 [Tyzzerella sp. An114]
MGKTRFMVIKFKELVKTAIFAILGTILIIAIIYFLIPHNSDDKSVYVPGVYTSKIGVNDDSLNIELTVDESQIKSVKLIHTSETIPVFYPLFESTAEYIGNEVVKLQDVSKVTVPEETAVTGNLIIDAIEESLQKAKNQ